MKNSGKQFRNIIILVALILFTILVMNNCNHEIDLAEIGDFISESHKGYLALAVACMILFIFLEGYSLYIINKHLGHKRSLAGSMVYSTADIYYSAITPSASGGQPASAYYMVKDGIPLETATTSLILNMVAYTTSIVIIGCVALVSRLSYFEHFNLLGKLLIISGMLIQLLISVFLVLCMTSDGIVKKCGNILISFMVKFKLFRKKKNLRESFDRKVTGYKEHIKALGNNKKIIVKVFVLNLLQRYAQILITYFIYMASGATGYGFIDIVALQSYCLLAVNSVPLPGGTGAFEGMFLDGFSKVFGKGLVVPALMVVRGISYYLCFIVSGIITLTYHVVLCKRSRE